MYDIRALEEEWKAYQAKKKKPYIFFILGIFVFLLVFFLFYNKKNIFSTLSKDSLNTVHKIDFQKKYVRSLVNPGLSRLEIQETYSENKVDNDENSNELLVDIPILDIKEKTKVENNIRKKVHLNIIETSNISAYVDVENRFLQSHDIDDALFLAKSYYRRSEYKKSEKWSLEVNKIDPNFEEGLFIFIKSKYKLGRKNNALSILKNYLTKTNTQSARELLYKMEHNKL